MNKVYLVGAGTGRGMLTLRGGARNFWISARPIASGFSWASARANTAPSRAKSIGF